MTPDVRARWAELLPSAGRMSVDELMALPEHRWRYELIAGQLTQRPPNDLRYDMILRLLVSALRDFVRSARIDGAIIPEAGVVVSAADEPDTVLVPALLFLRAEQVAVSDEMATIPLVRRIPDFVVEIAAPGQDRTLLAERAQTWCAAGTRVVWVIRPDFRQVDVWRSGRDVQASAEARTPEVTTCNVHEVLEVQDVLPGFTYPAAHLFT